MELFLLPSMKKFKIGGAKKSLVREREKTQLKLNQQKENMIKRIEQIQKQNKEIDPETINLYAYLLEIY